VSITHYLLSQSFLAGVSTVNASGIVAQLVAAAEIH